MTTITSITPIAIARDLLTGLGVSGINASGQVAAAFWNAAETQDLAGVWQAGSVTGTVSLSTLGANSYAQAINDEGVVAGYASDLMAGDPTYAFIWQNGTATELARLDGVGTTKANAINDSGTIVGYAITAQGDYEAVVWQNGAISTLNPLTSLYDSSPNVLISEANGINQSGAIVGYSIGPTGLQDAVLWLNGQPTDLGIASGYTGSSATAINNLDQVVGFEQSSIGPAAGFLWKNGVTTVLPNLPDTTNCAALAINDSGVIVGWADFGTGPDPVQHAVMWQNGEVFDLNNLLPAKSGWVLIEATGINAEGQVVGTGMYTDPQGYDLYSGFVLTLSGTTASLNSAQAVVEAYRQGTLTALTTVVDTAEDVAANLDQLQAVAAANDLWSITLTDSGGSPVLFLTPKQLADDSTVLGKIGGSFSVLVDSGSANVTLTGLAGHPTTVLLDSPYADYQLSEVDGNSSVEVDGILAGQAHDLFTGITTLQFSDGVEAFPGPRGIATIQSLGTLAAGTPVPASIDDLGEVVGTAGASQVPTGAVGFYWSDGKLVSQLPLAGASGTELFHVNNKELFVGESYEGNSSGGGSSTAVYWTFDEAYNGERPTSIGWLPGDFASIAIADNDAGAIVGISYTTGTTYQGFIWQNGTMSALGSLGGGQVEPLSINSAGAVTGKASVAGGNFHAFLWQNGTMTDLGTLQGGTTSVGAAIDDSGVIAGYATTSSGADQAVIWTHGQIAQLPNLLGGAASFANAENNKGWVAGEVYNSTQADATLWAGGAVYNLNAFLPSSSGWTLYDATGVNDQGQVVGVGAFNGQSASFVLTLPATLYLTADDGVNEFTAGLLTGQVAISDTGADIVGYLGGLAALAAAGNLGSITLTDSGTPNLSVTAAQLSADAAVLDAITGSYTLTVSAGAGAAAIAGLPGHATTVQFSGTISQYAVTAANGAVTVTGNGIADHLTNVAALQFNDVTEIVAATPGDAGSVTTGNVTELYSAVLAREPDLAGLTFYQTYLQKNPATPLLQFAEWFLDSAEYSSAHNYAQTAAGDRQFITDSYQNLLHRTPSASEISFYESNVLAPAVANLTPGTQAYAAAQLQAHAQMLVYFSASSEFLGDVQVTAANPASAQHWLILT